MTVKLDIFSDPICPWCYIGKTYLDRALAEFENPPFVIEWHPFQLNPDMPALGMDRRAYLEGKFGGQQGAVQAYLPVTQHAQAAGLEIALDRIQRTPNTLNAHRLIHWAGLEAKQTLVVSALFKAYFENGRDIGDVDELIAIGSACDMDPEMLSRLFASDADRDDLQARDQHARAKGITSVPTFLVANTYAISGAQSPEMWKNIIQELLEKLGDASAQNPENTTLH
jgi:predicted DsbA family dithiol-disulfide isomerase